MVFSNRQLPKCAISQAVTSQVCSSRSTQSLALSFHSTRPPSSSKPQRSALIAVCDTGAKLWEVAVWELHILEVPYTQVHNIPDPIVHKLIWLSALSNVSIYIELLKK